MKATVLTLLAFAILVPANLVEAQKASNSSSPTGVKIADMSWHKEMINPALNANDPFAINEAQAEQAQKEKRTIKRRENSAPNQTTEEALPIVVNKPLTERDAPFPIYRYKFTVKNTGRRTIQRLYWEYQFLDPDTNEVMGNQQIFSNLNLAPGKSRRINAFSFKQPTRLVSAAQLDKKYRDQFTERLIIHRIHYADGTAWQRLVE